MDKEFEKMRSGQMYRFDGGDIMRSLTHAKRACRRLNALDIDDPAYREAIEDLIPGIPPTSTVCPPFYCDHGHGIVMGEHVFVNYNCVMLDGAYIRIGHHVKIGPSCNFFTPNHPADYMARREPQETALPISIGDDTWIGGGVTVCPGATIGSRCIIAAGSVVKGHIPDDCLAAGNPATVKRRLNE